MLVPAPCGNTVPFAMALVRYEEEGRVLTYVLYKDDEVVQDAMHVAHLVSSKATKPPPAVYLSHLRCPQQLSFRPEKA